MFCAVENKLTQTNRPIMYTRAVTFKALCSMGTYGKPVETQIAAQRARVSGWGGGEVYISDRLPGHSHAAHHSQVGRLTF